MSVTSIYEGPDHPPSDDGFCRGDLASLVVGSRGRLLDARRTPVVVVRLDEQTAMFEVEVRAFEDQGARWRVPFEEIESFQFPSDAPQAGSRDVKRWRQAVAQLSQPLEVRADPERADETQRLIAQRRGEFTAKLARVRVDAKRAIVERGADRRASQVVTEILGNAGVLEIDEEFARAWASNPWGAGELIKGHALVAADLGLWPYRGTIVRDPDLFAGAWSRERRAAHLITRLAVTAELWRCVGGADEVKLYRAWATEGELDRRATPAFVSTTFSRQVAESLFEPSPRTRTAVMVLHTVPVSRLFMTFLETPRLSERFQEAEAVVLGLPALGTTQR